MTVLLFHLPATSQTLPVGIPALEDAYRRSQLDTISTLTSFTIRPIAYTTSAQTWTSHLKNNFQVKDTSNNILSNTSFTHKKFKAIILPIQLQTRFNSNHPYGWNDGPIIPAKGLQTFLSMGVFASWGPLSIQIKPEWIRAANKAYEGFTKEHLDVIAARYYDYYNKIDLPERFGTSTFEKIFLGQSSIRLNFQPVSVGVSTENLWWGPGKYNSILMSNTAPGLKHLTLNTSKPINTFIGALESQIIAAWPETTSYGVLQTERSYFSNPLFVPKTEKQRILSGMILTWQPRWIKNLFLGIARTKQMLNDEKGLNMQVLIPSFSFFNSNKPDQKAAEYQQMESLFFRWIWAENRIEVYGEWAHHNRNSQLVSEHLTPDRNRAYLFGLTKILPRNKRGEYFMFSAEVIQLQQTYLDDIKSFNTWYIHPTITPGYTHRGQSIGAGIGPGANAQHFELSWHRGFKKIGLLMERVVHNNDFYYYAFEDSKDFRRHWVDLNVKAGVEWDFNRLLINSHILANRSYNYNWYLLQKPGYPYFVHGKNAFNLQIQLGINYSF